MSQDKNNADMARRCKRRAQGAEATYKKPDGNTGFTPEEVLAALWENETGDAKLLVTAMRNRFVFDVKRQIFFKFAGGYWKKDLKKEALAFACRTLREAYGKEAARQHAISTDPEVDKEAQEAAKRRHDALKSRIDRINTLRRLKSVLELAITGDDGLAITGDEWNPDPWTIQAGELLIDLKTGEAQPGMPGDFINKAAPTAWKGLDEPAVTWRMSLLEIFNGNAELMSYVQRVLGTSLVGKPSQQEFYVFHGPEGRNGKGTILETLKEVLGSDLANVIKSDMIMESRQSSGGSADPELLEMQGRRIVWASETGESKKLNTEKMKLFTGGDTLSGRYNYSNEIISFKPTHTLFLLTNFKPRIGADNAAWDRLRLIPFSLRFVDTPKAPNERKKDTALDEKLLQEASGILAWLVQGCLDTLKNGLNPPKIVTEAVEEYRLDEDIVQQFIDERCYLGTGYKVQKGHLLDDFKKWHSETFGEKATPPSPQKVSTRLQNMPGIQREKTSRVVFLHGIALAAKDAGPDKNTTNKAGKVKDDEF